MSRIGIFCFFIIASMGAPFAVAAAILVDDVSNAILLNTRLPGVSMQFDLIDEETLRDHAIDYDCHPLSPRSRTLTPAERHPRRAPCSRSRGAK